MSGFADIRSHFVYGLDDGAKTKEDMEAMLDAANADGIASLFATPHMTPGLLPFDHAAFTQRLNEARGYCQRHGYPMTLYAGAEIMCSPAIRQHVLERRLPTLAGTENVLVEFLPDISYRELEDAVELIERSGYLAVLAHIERYDCLLHAKNAWRLKEEHDVRYQVNANTVIEGRGFLRTRIIRSWFQGELIDFVASDAHNCKGRPFRMRPAYDALKREYGSGYASRLTGLE